jgi:hypothetical protein
VLEMLARLTYLPEDPGSETPRTSEQPVGGALDASPATVTGVPIVGEVAEGGMVALLRDVVVKQSIAAEPAAVNIDSLLGVPVRMDSAHGKFQAFEVSTGEDAPPSAAPPAANDATTRPPLRPAMEPIPVTVIEPLPEVLVQGDTAGGIFPISAESPAEETAPPASPPEPSDAKTSPHLNAAAAAIVFAFAARAARTARVPGASEPDNHPAITKRRPLPAR